MRVEYLAECLASSIYKIGFLKKGFRVSGLLFHLFGLFPQASKQVRMGVSASFFVMHAGSSGLRN